MKNRVLKIFETLPADTGALVLANSMDPHLDQSFFYLFDVPSGLFEGSVAVAYPDGQLHVLSSPLEEESAVQAAKHDPNVEVHVPQRSEESDALIQQLVPRNGPVALNYRELTHWMFLRFDKLVPGASWTDASGAIRKARGIKDSTEIERLERAGAIGSAVGKEIPGLLRSGVSELEVAAEMEYRMMKHGASGRSFSTIVAFGSNGAEPHYQPQQRKLEDGMSIVCDFGAFYHRYASDITRSFHFGRTDDELRRVHDTVEKAQAAALAVVRAGVPAKEVHLAAQRVIDDSPWKGRFTHGLGHSIGLAVHDGFGMNQLTEDPLEAGMTITVEPGIYIPGRGGVRIEDDILVTESGYRFLTTAPRGYLEVPA
ncbi:MAG TPA: aminopeptidase P family protein [Thermoplasmata archaeon]|nr:aminopeptidase P family protein [Thermoplasmata archaeon]